MHVTTFGEIMLRLTTPVNQKLIQATHFDSNYGGAEANVAVSLAQLGNQVAFITKLPKNDLGNAAASAVSQFGVTTTHISHGGSRLGLYFLQQGNGIRASNVIYDRANSSFATSNATDYNWDVLLTNTNYFYISGITPALSSGLQETLLTAVKLCQQHNITVVYDANYRKKSCGRQPMRSPLMNNSCPMSIFVSFMMRIFPRRLVLRLPSTVTANT